MQIFLSKSIFHYKHRRCFSRSKRANNSRKKLRESIETIRSRSLINARHTIGDLLINRRTNKKHCPELENSFRFISSALFRERVSSRFIFSTRRTEMVRHSFASSPFEATWRVELNICWWACLKLNIKTLSWIGKWKWSWRDMSSRNHLWSL